MNRIFAVTVSSVLVVLASSASAQPASEALTLEQAIAIAAAHNETPAIAAARVDRARAVLREAWAELLPSATVAATYTRRSRAVTRELGGATTTFQAFNALSGFAQARLQLLNAPAIPTIRAQKRRVEAAELSAAESRRQLAFEVSRAYLSIFAAEAVADAAAHRVEVADAIIADAEARLAAGLGNRNDVTRARLELAEARLAHTNASAAARAARIALGYLMAADSPARPLVRPELAPPPAALRESLAATAQANRADLEAAARIAEAARIAARAPLLGVVPSLDVVGTYRATNETGFSGRSTDWNVALTLTWVLYDGGLRYARARAERAEAREAELVAHQLTRQIDTTIRQALLDLEAAESAIAQAAVRVEVADQNAGEVAARYRSGLATSLEVADANLAAFEAAAAAAEASLQGQLARLELSRALGEWPKDILR